MSESSQKKIGKIVCNTVIFCDDIRHEISGKQTLVGAYGSDIVVPSVPTTLAVAAWIEIKLVQPGNCSVRIKVTDPAGNIAGQTVMDVDTGEVHGKTGVIPLPPLPITVIKPGLIKVHWALNGGSFQEIAQKTVVIGEVTNFFQPLRAVEKAL